MGARRCGLQHCGARLPAGWVGWVGANRKGEPSMFVFKAAVVGAGTMGGEIAQTIASADIPVVLKDVDPKFVETGLEKARSLWQSRVDAGKMESAELERKLGLITGATDYDGFGDV